MASAQLKDCDKCSGAGTVPRERRKLADGETPDPLDFRRREVCDKCGGGGKIPERYEGVRERMPGFAADQI